MKLLSLYIPDYYILSNFKIKFDKKLSIVIGDNGSGKSSLIEVIALIFGHLHKYYILNDKTAEFIDGYIIEYEIKGRKIRIESHYVDQATNTFKPDIWIDNVEYSNAKIDNEFGDFSYFLPTKTILFYSGITDHLSQLFNHFRVKYRKNLIAKKEYSLVPLRLPVDNPFCYIGKDSLPLLALSIFLSSDYSEQILHEKLGINVSDCETIIVIKEPDWYKKRGDNNAEGKYVDGILPNITDSVTRPLLDRMHDCSYDVKADSQHNEMTLYFLGVDMIQNIFSGLNCTPSDAFSLFDVLLCSDIIKQISITWKENGQVLSLDRLSEGQKQLLLTWGASVVWSEKDLLFLFDEPDAYLHPKWQREFISELSSCIREDSCAVVSTHSPTLLGNADNSDLHILDKGIYKSAPLKFYGKDNNAILIELMGVTKRADEIEKKLDSLFDAIEKEKVADSKELLSELSAILGSTDSDLIKAKVLIDYLED